MDRTKGQLLRRTKSICPECYDVLDACITRRNDEVWIEKTCSIHGFFEEIYSRDYDFYHKAELYRCNGSGVSNPKIEVVDDKIVCPKDCGLCRQHMTHTILGNIFLTNRCNLNCWYCFANARKQGFVYEPTLESIKFMLKTLRDNKPVSTYAVQFTGGEPTVRDDMCEIITTARDMGFLYILINTNGIRIAETPGLAQKYKDAGINVAYLSFDGVTEATNPKNFRYVDRILEEMRKARIPVTLVPTIIKGVNDHEVGAIIDFAIKNQDIVRGVNFQPISFVGKMKQMDRAKMRVTIPDLLFLIEEQTSGNIPKTAFYTVPVTIPLSRFIEAATGSEQTKMTVHPQCGVGTYVIMSGDKIIPITDIIDVDAFAVLLNKISEKLTHKVIGKIEALAEVCKDIEHCVDVRKIPKEFNLKDAIIDVLSQKPNALGVLHDKLLFIGTMHFQDAYNYDIERLKRCGIHYVVPDGRIIPFCAYNGMPEIYRDKINESCGIPADKWIALKKKELHETA